MTDSDLRMAFVGDLSLGLPGREEWGLFEFPGWQPLMDAVGRHDLLVGNLECCFVDARCGEQARKERMAVPSSAAQLLQKAGFSVLNLANNHMLDCGAEAIAVTREHLSALDIRFFGAGMDLAEAEAATYLERGGREIALLGACDSVRYYAADGRAGIAPLNKASLGRRVCDASHVADLVVVTLHADLEFSAVPGRWRQRLSRWLIEQGADLVIQHHPHVLQGVEEYKGGLIAYSLGNFIFRLRGNAYQEHRPGVFDSGILVVDADFDGATPRLSYRIVPAHIADDHFPRRVSGADQEKAVQKFNGLSRLVVDDRAHRRIWFQRCRKEGVSRLFGIYYAFGRLQVGRALGMLWRLAARQEDRRWILGLISFGYL